MSKETTEKICLQDELPIVLITTMELKTFIKGYHVYKDTWIPKEGEQFEVFMEPDNPKDKLAVCVKVNKKIAGHLKKGATGRFAKTIFFFLRSDPYSNSSVQITGKRCNLGDGEGMQVPCRLSLSGQAKYMKNLKQELTKMKEI